MEKKITRLEKLVGKETFDVLFKIYLDAKSRHNINDVQIFKSFITRIIEAQNDMEYHDGKWHKQWATLEDYTMNVILHCGNFFVKNTLKDCTPFGYIKSCVTNTKEEDTHGAFKYNMKEHFRRTL